MEILLQWCSTANNHALLHPLVLVNSLKICKMFEKYMHLTSFKSSELFQFSFPLAFILRHELRTLSTGRNSNISLKQGCQTELCQSVTSILTKMEKELLPSAHIQSCAIQLWRSIWRARSLPSVKNCNYQHSWAVQVQKLNSCLFLNSLNQQRRCPGRWINELNMNVHKQLRVNTEKRSLSLHKHDYNKPAMCINVCFYGYQIYPCERGLRRTVEPSNMTWSSWSPLMAKMPDPVVKTDDVRGKK